jgi:hypothetical protein
MPASEWFFQVDPVLAGDRIDGHQISPAQIAMPT